jgi:hypothetical protein
MKQFFKLIATCFGLLVSMAVISLRIGIEQAPAPYIPGLSRCGELVCYLEILPGKTAWDDGLRAIHKVPELKAADTSDKYFISSNPSYKVGFLPYKYNVDAHSWVFQEININMSELAISVGNVMAVLGPPCFVSSGNGILFLGWPNSAFLVSDSPSSFTPSSQVLHIVIHQHSIACPKPGKYDSVRIYEWRGFRDYP